MVTTVYLILHLEMAAIGHPYTPTYPNLLQKYAGNGFSYVAHLNAVSMETRICQGGSIAKYVFLDSLSLCAKFQFGNKKCTIQPKFGAMPPDSWEIHG